MKTRISDILIRVAKKSKIWVTVHSDQFTNEFDGDGLEFESMDDFKKVVEIAKKLLSPKDIAEFREGISNLQAKKGDFGILLY